MNDDAAIQILHPLLLGIVCVILKESCLPLSRL